MCWKHRWSEWEEDYSNCHKWSRPKLETRTCQKCWKKEKRIYPSLEKRIVNLFQEGYSEEAINKTLEKFKRDYGVAHFTRVSKEWAKF